MPNIWAKDVKSILDTNPPVETINALVGMVARRYKYNSVLLIFDHFKSKGMQIPSGALNALCCSEFRCFDRINNVINEMYKYDIPVDFQCSCHGNTLLWGITKGISFDALIDKGVDIHHVNKMGQTIFWRLIEWTRESFFTPCRFRKYINIHHRDNIGQSIFYHMNRLAVFDPTKYPETVATRDILLTPDNKGKLSIHAALESRTPCMEKLIGKYMNICRFICRIPYNNQFFMEVFSHNSLFRTRSMFDYMLHKDHVTLLLVRPQGVKYKKVYTLKTTMLLYLFRNYNEYRDLIINMPETLLDPGDPSRDVIIDDMR